MDGSRYTSSCSSSQVQVRWVRKSSDGADGAVGGKATDYAAAPSPVLAAYAYSRPNAAEMGLSYAVPLVLLPLAVGPASCHPSLRLYSLASRSRSRVRVPL
jgi:hypothetical protein